MSAPGSFGPRPVLLAASVLGTIFVGVACSSSAGSSPAAGASEEREIDSGVQHVPDSAAGDGGDASDVTPVSYDFTVKCAVEPCVTRLAARGGAHACVVLDDGSVRCWGSNASGQLGRGADEAGAMPPYEMRPRRVSALSNVVGVAATGSGRFGTTCAVASDGAVSCFGSDTWGQLGRGLEPSSDPHPEPAVVGGLQAKSVALASTFAFAVDEDDRLWSWGRNDARQLARPTLAPEIVTASQPARADGVSRRVEFAAGTSKTGFAGVEGGVVLSWGGGTFDELGRTTSLAEDPTPSVIALADVSGLATGTAHACAVSRGRVYCWGSNESGQLGTTRKADEWLPVPAILPLGVHAVAIAAAASGTCIIASEGDVYCWGANDSGQTGAAALIDQPMPVRVGGLNEEVVALALMDESTCVLLRGGSVACWGDNLLGQLGRGTRDIQAHIAPATVLFE